MPILWRNWPYFGGSRGAEPPWWGVWEARPPSWIHEELHGRSIEDLSILHPSIHQSSISHPSTILRSSIEDLSEIYRCPWMPMDAQGCHQKCTKPLKSKISDSASTQSRKFNYSIPNLIPPPNSSSLELPHQLSTIHVGGIGQSKSASIYMHPHPSSRHPIILQPFP